MSSRKKVVLALCLAIAAIAWAYIKGSQSDRGTRYSPSTYSAGPWGCKALYLVLEELKLPVKRFRQSFSRLASHRGVLVITGPLRSPISPRERLAVQQWIEGGNRLLVCDGTLKTSLTRMRGVDTLHKREGSLLPRMRSPSSFLHVQLKEFPDSSFKVLLPQLPDLDASARISISGENRWKDPSKEWDTLIGDEAGPILISKKMGKGRVHALADVTVASNDHIRDEQNLRLVLALLLARGRPQEILFDEFHQGHVAHHSLWTYVGSSIFGWMVLQGLLGLGLFFFSKRAQYAGRYRLLASPKGRSSLEYVDSMAGVYESCKAGALALGSMLNRFLGRLSRRTGMPLRRLIETSPDRIATVAGSGQEGLPDLLQRCHQVADAGQQTPEALALAKQLASATHRIRGFDRT
jgi:hypothetical protein